MTDQPKFKWFIVMSLYVLDEYTGQMIPGCVASSSCRSVDSPIESLAASRAAAQVCADAMHCNYADRSNTDAKEDSV